VSVSRSEYRPSKKADQYRQMTSRMVRTGSERATTTASRGAETPVPVHCRAVSESHHPKRTAMATSASENSGCEGRRVKENTESTNGRPSIMPSPNQKPAAAPVPGPASRSATAWVM
jgi:hypothetical protein